MLNPPPEEAVLERLVAWGRARPDVGAMVLTSSRARGDETVDLLSDYDLILAVTDAQRLAQDDAWQLDYGRPMVRWGDEGARYGWPTFFRGVVYEDGVKIDYSLWPLALVDEVSAREALPDVLDVGYRVLLDKDGRTSGWPPPTYRAHVPPRPTEGEYRALVEELWWSATYMAKSLWRGELVFAKFCLEYDMKLVALRRLLEWRLEIDHDWSVRPGVWGRGLERRLPPDTWSALASTYVGADLEANWAALLRTTALGRQVASEVAAALGYTYPQDVDDEVSAYVNSIRRWQRDARPRAGREGSKAALPDLGLDDDAQTE